MRAAEGGARQRQTYHEQLQQQHQQKQQALGRCVGPLRALLGDVSLRTMGLSRSAGTGPVY